MNIKCFDGTDNNSTQNREKGNPMAKRQQNSGSSPRGKKRFLPIVKILRIHKETCINMEYIQFFLLPSNMSPDHQIKIP